MQLVQHPGLYLTTRFDRLGRGEEFDFSATAPSDPYVKIGDGLYGLLNGAGPTDNNRFQPFGSVTDVTGMVRYYTPPALSISGARQVVTPRPASGLSYYSSIDSQGAANQGADPVLGPPFAPVFYQLFIDTPSIYANTSGSGPAAHLYWTIPDVSIGIQVIKPQVNNPYKNRVWFGLVNDISQASQIDVVSSASQYIHPANYIWFANWTNSNTVPPSTPVGSGFTVPGGTDFNGFCQPIFQAIPGYNPGDMKFIAEPAQSIDHFELKRSRGDSSFTDNINLGIPPLGSLGTTTGVGFTTVDVGSSISNLLVVDSSLVSVGQQVIITTAGLYLITGIANATHITVQSIASSANVTSGTVIATGQRVAPIQTADDPADRDANTNYFYQLRGKLSTGALLSAIPYNFVGLIHPYTLDPPQVIKDNNGVFQKTRLTWNAPSAAEVAAWPTTPA